ncbi:hypothetical protein ACIPJG_32240 [Streptomyces halstedii]|uniref:hypothetical protein n=1 Tax=Streptomyces halstedii TaxID=1944 RepID=UPI003813A9CA
MRDLYVETALNLEVLAQSLAEMLLEDLLEFVLNVDACIADTSFTRELIEQLENILIEEEGGRGKSTDCPQ